MKNLVYFCAFPQEQGATPNINFTISRNLISATLTFYFCEKLDVQTFRKCWFEAQTKVLVWSLDKRTMFNPSNNLKNPTKLYNEFTVTKVIFSEPFLDGMNLLWLMSKTFIYIYIFGFSQKSKLIVFKWNCFFI